MDPILIRQLTQNLICSDFKSPEEVVNSMGAMQAQDYWFRLKTIGGY